VLQVAVDEALREVGPETLASEGEGLGRHEWLSDLPTRRGAP
jgi:hypothetical protein